MFLVYDYYRCFFQIFRKTQRKPIEMFDKYNEERVLYLFEVTNELFSTRRIC